MELAVKLFVFYSFCPFLGLGQEGKLAENKLSSRAVE
jgi:hypothetical protein